MRQTASPQSGCSLTLPAAAQRCCNCCVRPAGHGVLKLVCVREQRIRKNAPTLSMPLADAPMSERQRRHAPSRLTPRVSGIRVRVSETRIRVLQIKIRVSEIRIRASEIWVRLSEMFQMRGVSTTRAHSQPSTSWAPCWHRWKLCPDRPQPVTIRHAIPARPGRSTAAAPARLYTPRRCPCAPGVVRPAKMDSAPCAAVTAHSMQRATRNVQHATCNVQRAMCSMQRAACKVHHTTCRIQHAACNVEPPLRPIRAAPPPRAEARGNLGLPRPQLR